MNPIANVGGRCAPTSFAATALLTIAGSNTKRRAGVEVTAYSDGPVYVKIVQKGASAPTVSSTNYDWYVPAYGTLELRVDTSIDIYCQNGTASAVEVY